MCVHPTSSPSAKATVELLEEDFAHFGNPHTLVSELLQLSPVKNSKAGVPLVESLI